MISFRVPWLALSRASSDGTEGTRRGRESDVGGGKWVTCSESGGMKVGRRRETREKETLRETDSKKGTTGGERGRQRE